MQGRTELSPYAETIKLQCIQDVDKNIIYRDYEKKGSPYTYVVKILEINKDRLRAMFNLHAFHVDADSDSFHIQGENRHIVSQAVQRIVGILKEPVFTLKVNPEIVVVLRILKDVKKDFSVQTGCWLHFIWVSRTVSCYGLDSQSASDYVHHIIDGVRRCAMSPGGCNGYIVAEQAFERKYKNLIKKYVDYIESKSGSKLAVKKDDVAMGQVVVQFYGTPADITEAFRVIEADIMTRPIDESGPFPATPCPPGAISHPDHYMNSRKSWKRAHQHQGPGAPGLPAHGSGQLPP
eukprot:RCo005063